METMKILIPVDFSESNETVLSFIQSLPERKKAGLQVTLLHFLQFPVVPGNFLSPVDFVGELYQKHMEAFTLELENLRKKPELDGVEVNAELIGSPGASIGESIADYARDNHFDLVLLISKHRKGLGGLFLSSELMRIMRFCVVPVLILSPDKPNLIRRIAFATDFSPASAKVFIQLKRVAEFLEAEIMCFKVNTVNEFQDQREFAVSRNEFINGLGFVDIPEIELYNSWEIDDGILFYAEDHLADAVALATHAYKGLSRLFNTSITEKVISETTYPVLVYNLDKSS